jgi:hypothetical protein
MLISPPKLADPTELFRTLTRVPYPRASFLLQLPAPSKLSRRFYVRAVSSLEIGAEMDEASLLATVLVEADGSRTFKDGETITRTLTIPFFNRLSLEVGKALALISPTRSRADWSEWLRAVKQSAQQPANILAAESLGSRMEAVDGILAHRPEIYFCIPAAQLVDAHWLCFEAANQLWRERAASVRQASQPLPPPAQSRKR